jgi:hypothetical protein
MAFYPHFSGFYAHPMYFPNQDFYAMYPPGSMESNQVFYQDANNNNSSGGGNPHHYKFNKPGYNNRKISQDSGISDFSSMASRKTSNTSTVSNISIAEEPAQEETKEPETPLEIPTDEMCEEIVQQVEFYFSNANITKDKFLLKHVKRNKEGFVSLKLISSFKRVKHLCKDWRQVAYAVEKKSEKLEVNDLKTKVRRLEALPEYDETTPSRTVVVLNLPMDRPTIEGVAEIFKACGDIVLVRILRPGNPIPADVRPFVNKHPEMSAKVCALVEFERTEFAKKAVCEQNCEEEEKMKVMELTAPPPAKTSKKNEEKRKMMQANKQQSGMASGQQQPQRRYSQGMLPPQMMMASEAAQASAPRRKVSLMHNMKFSPMAEQQQKANSLNPNAPIFTMQQRRLSRPSQPSAPHPAHFMMEPAFGMMHPMQPFPGWMTRRISGQMEYAASGLALPHNVLRQPRGPAEKGKGFQKWCKNRMEPARKPGSRAVPIVAPPPAQSPSIAKEEKKMEDKKDIDVVVEEAAEGAAAAPQLPKISINPVIVIHEESCTSEEDEGHFSDAPAETEKSR